MKSWNVISFIKVHELCALVELRDYVHTSIYLLMCVCIYTCIFK